MRGVPAGRAGAEGALRGRVVSWGGWFVAVFS